MAFIDYLRIVLDTNAWLERTVSMLGPLTYEQLCAAYFAHHGRHFLVLPVGHRPIDMLEFLRTESCLLLFGDQWHFVPLFATRMKTADGRRK
jgi:hypothetical protein